MKLRNNPRATALPPFGANHYFGPTNLTGFGAHTRPTAAATAETFYLWDFGPDADAESTRINHASIVSTYSATTETVTDNTEWATALSNFNAGTTDLILVNYAGPTGNYTVSRSSTGYILGYDPTSWPTINGTGNQITLDSTCDGVVVGFFNWTSAYRTSGDPPFFVFDGCSNCRLTEFTATACGYSDSTRCIETTEAGGSGNRLDHFVVDDARAFFFTILGWSKQWQVTSIVDNGDGTQTWTTAGGDTSGATGFLVNDVIRARGANQAAYVGDAIVVSENASGTTFKTAIGGSPGNATWKGEYAKGMVRLITTAPAINTRVDHFFVKDQTGTNRQNRITFQPGGSPRYHVPEPGNATIEKGVVYNLYSEIINDKADDTTVRQLVGFQNDPEGSTFSVRNGKDKTYTQIITPKATINLKDKEHVITNCVFKSFTVEEWGSLDDGGGGGSNNNEFPDNSNMHIGSVTCVQGSGDDCELFRSGGVSPNLADNPPTGLTMKNVLILKNGTGVAVDNQKSADSNYYTDNSITQDNWHFWLQGGATAGELGTNSTSSDAKIEGVFELQSSSPCISAAASDANVTTDVYGTPRDANPDTGAFEFVSPTLSIQDNFTGTGNLTAHTPDIDTEAGGYTAITATPTLDGSGAVQFSTANYGAVIDVGSATHRIRLKWDDGNEANDLIVWARTNSGFTEGVGIELDVAADEFRIIERLASSNTTKRTAAWPTSTGEHIIDIWVLANTYYFRLNASPVWCYTEATTKTGTYVGFQHGARAGSAGRVNYMEAAKGQAPA